MSLIFGFRDGTGCSGTCYRGKEERDHFDDKRRKGVTRSP